MRAFGARTFVRLGLALVLGLAFLPARAWAQTEPAETEPAEAELPRAALTHPDGPLPGDFQLGLGLAIDVAPTQVVENAPRTIPIIQADARIGLPAGFSIPISLWTQIVTTYLLVGPAITFGLGPVRTMVGYLVAPYFGFLGSFGFETLSWGFSNQPFVRFGGSFAKTHFTLELAFDLSFGRAASFGGNVISEPGGPKLLGGHIALVFETELGNGGMIRWSVSLLRREGGAVLWAAFSDETASLMYPRFQVGYVF